MDFKSLQAYLKPDYGQVKIRLKHFDRNFDAFLNETYASEGQTILIHSIEGELNIDEGLQQISFSGQADFLNLPDLTAHATYTLNPSGNVEVFIVYNLPVKPGKEDSWKFSDCFPEQKGLNELQLEEAAWVVSSLNSQDGRWKRGINFAGKVISGPELGLPKGSLAAGTSLELNGYYCPAAKPDRPQIPRSLKGMKGAQPWDFITEMPGIHLSASMPGHITLGGQMLKAPQLRMYYPTTARWLEKDKQFISLRALTSMLVGQAWVVNVIGLLEEEGLEFTASKDDSDYFDPKLLAGTLGLAEGENLFSESLQEVAASAEEVKLTQLRFSLKEGDELSLESLDLSLSFEEASWALQGDTLTAGEIESHVSVVYNDAKPEVKVEVQASSSLGKIPLELSIPGRDPGPILAVLKRTSNLRLPALLEILGAESAGVPDLAVAEASLEILPGKSIRLKGGFVSKGSPHDLDVSAAAPNWQDLRFDILLPEKGKQKGKLTGVLSWGKDVPFDFEQELFGDGEIRAKGKDLPLSYLLRRMASQKLPLPRGFELNLAAPKVLISGEGDASRFHLAAKIGKEGLLILESCKREGGYGLAMVLQQGGGGLTSIPGLEGLSEIEKKIKITDWELSLANFEDKSYVFPEAKNILKGKAEYPVFEKGVREGLIIQAQWEPNIKDPEQKLIKKIAGLKAKVRTDLLPGSNPQRDLRLRTQIKAKLPGNLPFEGGLGLEIRSGEVQYFLAGTSQVTLGDTRYAAKTSLEMSSGGALLRGEIAEALHIGNTDLESAQLLIQVDSSGAHQSSVLGDLPSGKGQVLLISDKENQNKVLLSGGVLPLALSEAVQVFSGKSLEGEAAELFGAARLEAGNPLSLPTAIIPSLDARKTEDLANALSEAGLKVGPEKLFPEVLQAGRSWSLHVAGQGSFDMSRAGNNLLLKPQVQLYRATEKISSEVGDFSKGYYVKGKMKIQDLSLDGRFDIVPGKGLSGKSQLEAPLVIGDENFFRLSGRSAGKGPALSFATYDKKSKAGVEKAGLKLKGNLRLLGLETGAADLGMKGEGFVFSTQQTKDLEEVAPGYSGKAGLKVDLKGTVGTSQQFEAEGSLMISLDGVFDLAQGGLTAGRNAGEQRVGDFPLKTVFKGSLRIHSDGRKTQGLWEGEYEFEGKKGSFSFELDPKRKGLADAGSQVIKLLIGKAGDYLKDPWVYLQAVQEGKLGKVENAKGLGALLSGQFRQGASEAAMLLHEADFERSFITSVLHEGYGKDAASVGLILTSLGVDAKGIAENLREKMDASASDLVRILIKSGEEVNTIATLLKSVFGLNGRDASAILKEQGVKASAIAKMLKKVSRQSAAKTLPVLQELGYKQEEIASSLRTVFGMKARDSAKALLEAQVEKPEVAAALLSAYKVPERLMAEILREHGAEAPEIGAILKSRYRTAPVIVIELLKEGGADVNALCRTLGEAYGQSDRQSGRLLQQAGFALEAIAPALQKVYSLDGAALVALIKGMNASVAGTMKMVAAILGTEPEVLASWLFAAGAKATDIADALQEQTDLSAAKIAVILQQAGQDIKSIAKILRQSLDQSAQEAASVLTNDLKAPAEELKALLKSAGYASSAIQEIIETKEGQTAE